ncbi:hypothetical protein SAMN04488544_3316 [Microlunatus sagamiharensis]|uniref:Uncharacterized protein n=1 Tax=Microlunatus sagamiharensis TaxID=546874 RepID=A0A1H2N548_9ACTN|nr:hypothetical protein [Microlunatus sagamiharensis]SDV00424.1 hypothetical protein SAMN04488544_3316 [Microlunatus sagamiharensis]
MGRSASLVRAAAVAAALIGLCGCSGDPSRIEPTPAPTTIEPLIDPQRGQILLPLDQFITDEQQDKTLNLAQQLVVRDCLDAAGTVVPVVDVRNTAVFQSRRYGLWTSEQAELGYGLPAPTRADRDYDAYLKDIEKINKTDTYKQCVAAPDYTKFTLQFTESQVVAADTYHTFMDSSQARQVISEWEACLRAGGVDPNPDQNNLWSPVGSTGGPLATRKRVAETDVACKGRTNLVSRMSALEATAEQPTVARYWVNLQQQRERIDSTMADAGALIAQHGY